MSKRGSYLEVHSTEQFIHIVRRQRVILDKDLAKIYGVQTRRLNEQVRRNLHRFPEDFAFQLTRAECINLISQNATSSSQRGGYRKLPFAIPTREQAGYLETLAKRAVAAKELALRKQDPSPELIKYCRQLVKEQQYAPKYLQPHPQFLLLDSAEDCLTAIELSVQWEVEKLYGVEGLGPFDEF